LTPRKTKRKVLPKQPWPSNPRNSECQRSCTPERDGFSREY